MEATTPTGATSTTFSTPTTLTVLAHLCEQIEAGRIAEAKVEASKLLDDGVFRFGELLSVAYGHLRWNEPSADTQRLFALLDHQNLQHEDLLRCQVARLGRLSLEACRIYGGGSDPSDLKFRLEKIRTNEPEERVRLRFELSCALQALAANDLHELAAAIRKETGPFVCNDKGWYSSAFLLTWVGSLCCKKNEHLGTLLRTSGSNNDENVTLAAIDAYDELATCSDEGRRQVACSQLVALCRDSRWHLRYRAVEVLLTLVTDTAFVKQVEPALFSLCETETNSHIRELLKELDRKSEPPRYSPRPPPPHAEGMDPRVHRARDYLTNLAEVGVGGVEVVLLDLKAAVEGGAVDARYELAICLALKKDPAAIPLLREEQWHPGAQFLLATLVPEEALNFLIPLAQGGDARANLALGDLYWEGRSPVQKSPQQAYRHWKEAAKAGNRRAQANVGYCLAQGIAIESNLEEALSWLSQAAAQGDREAHFNRAVCLLRRNQEGDVEAAAEHLSEADTLPDPALKEGPLSVLSQFASITFTVDEFRNAAQQVDSPLAKRLLAIGCARRPRFMTELRGWPAVEKDLTQAADAGDKITALELAALKSDSINRDQLHVLLSKAGIAMPHEHPLSTLHLLIHRKSKAQQIPFSADRTAYAAWDVCQHPKASGEAVQKCWEIAIKGGCREARSGLIENYLRFQKLHPSDDLLYRRFLDIDTRLWEQYKPQFRSWLRPGYLLAECFRLGIGGKKDPVKAVQMLWTELRNTSCSKARSRLALCYALGVGVDRDRSTALKIIQEGELLDKTQAAKKGDMRDMVTLARLQNDFEQGLRFSWGIGTEVNRVEAKRLLLKAAFAGHAVAKDWLKINPRVAVNSEDDNDSDAKDDSGEPSGLDLGKPSKPSRKPSFSKHSRPIDPSIDPFSELSGNDLINALFDEMEEDSCHFSDSDTE